MLLRGNQHKHLAWTSEIAYSPRAPYFSSIKNTRWTSDVSKVMTMCSRCLGVVFCENPIDLTPMRLRASRMYTSVVCDVEKIKNFSFAE